MPVFPGFIGGSYVLDSLDSSADRTVNLYPERNKTGFGKSPWRLRGTPGLLNFITLTGGGPVWAIYYESYTGRLFAVSGPRGGDS